MDVGDGAVDGAGADTAPDAVPEVMIIVLPLPCTLMDASI